MKRREVVSVIGSGTVLQVTGCIVSNGDSTDATGDSTDATGDSTEQDCSSVEIIRQVTVTEGDERPTPGTGTETPTADPDYEDYVLVVVENKGSNAYTLTGYINGNGGKREYSRKIPAEKGTYEFKFGPYGHHGIEDYQFNIEGC